MAACHTVKCEAPYFEHVDGDHKTFEVRKDDRGYLPGDVIVLREIDADGRFTGRTCGRVITYKMPGGKFGVVGGYCVLGLARSDIADHFAKRERGVL